MNKTPAQDVTVPHPKAYSAWQVLSSAFGLAISPRCLSLAAIGILLSAVSWSLIGSLCGVSESRPELKQHSSELLPLQLINVELLGATREASNHPLSRLGLAIDSVVLVPYSIVSPWMRLFDPNVTWRNFWYFCLGGVASVLIWSVFGLAICRLATFHCGRREVLKLANGVEFAKRKWGSVAAAPLATIMAIAMIGIPVFAIGWMIRFDLGFFVVACLWGIVLAVSLLLSVLALGLLFAWPLMWGAIAAEDSDFFDAISRSFAYTYQRPLHYLRFLAQATLLAVLGCMLASFFCEMVSQLGFWAISITGGVERANLLSGIAEASVDVADAEWVRKGRAVITFWTRSLRLLAGAFAYSFFWCALTSIYLMLRFETDETQLDDIVTNTPK